MKHPVCHSPRHIARTQKASPATEPQANGWVLWKLPAHWKLLKPRLPNSLSLLERAPSPYHLPTQTALVGIKYPDSGSVGSPGGIEMQVPTLPGLQMHECNARHCFREALACPLSRRRGAARLRCQNETEKSNPSGRAVLSLIRFASATRALSLAGPT